MSATIPDLEQASAQEVIAYAIENFHPRLKTACSFQKEESVLFHMLSEITPDAHRGHHFASFSNGVIAMEVEPQGYRIRTAELRVQVVPPELPTAAILSHLSLPSHLCSDHAHYFLGEKSLAVGANCVGFS